MLKYNLETGKRENVRYYTNKEIININVVIFVYYNYSRIF